MTNLDKNAIAVALVVGLGLLALLFAGQVWSFAARWIGRSIAGAVQIMLAVGVAYVVYQVYSGWRAADDTGGGEYESSLDLQNELAPSDEPVDTDLSNPDQQFDQEIEEELESLSE